MIFHKDYLLRATEPAGEHPTRIGYRRVSQWESVEELRMFSSKIRSSQHYLDKFLKALQFAMQTVVCAHDNRAFVLHVEDPKLVEEAQIRWSTKSQVNENCQILS